MSVCRAFRCSRNREGLLGLSQTSLISSLPTFSRASCKRWRKKSLFPDQKIEAWKTLDGMRFQ